MSIYVKIYLSLCVRWLCDVYVFLWVYICKEVGSYTRTYIRSLRHQVRQSWNYGETRTTQAKKKWRLSTTSVWEILHCCWCSAYFPFPFFPPLSRPFLPPLRFVFFFLFNLNGVLFNFVFPSAFSISNKKHRFMKMLVNGSINWNLQSRRQHFQRDERKKTVKLCEDKKLCARERNVLAYFAAWCHCSLLTECVPVEITANIYHDKMIVQLNLVSFSSLKTPRTRDFFPPL